jgi:hypothetical protein
VFFCNIRANLQHYTGCDPETFCGLLFFVFCPIVRSVIHEDSLSLLLLIRRRYCSRILQCVLTAMSDLMCLGPTVQRPAAYCWRSRGHFMHCYYIITRPRLVMSVEKLTIGPTIKAKRSALGNKFALHME